MFRQPLPSEVMTTGLDYSHLSDWMSEDEDPVLPVIEPESVTSQIFRLCGSIDGLSASQRERIGKVLKMPLAPLALISSAAAAAAAFGCIPAASAAIIGAASACYSGMKGYGLACDMFDNAEMRKQDIADLGRLLEEVPERDILIVRSMLDQRPEIRSASDCW